MDLFEEIYVFVCLRSMPNQGQVRYIYVKRGLLCGEMFG